MSVQSRANRKTDIKMVSDLLDRMVGSKHLQIAWKDATSWQINYMRIRIRENKFHVDDPDYILNLSPKQMFRFLIQELPPIVFVEAR